MADPLTGLATVAAVSSILSVIDFSGKVVVQATKLAKGTNNALEENQTIEQLIRENDSLAKLIVSDLDGRRPLSSAEQSVDKIAQECRRKAQELLITLNELKIEKDSKGAKRAFQSAKLASKALMKRSTIVKQREQLEALQDRLSDHLLNILRTTQASHLEAIVDRIDSSTAKTASEIITSQRIILQEVQARGSPPNEKALSVVDSLRFSDMRLRRDAIPEAYQGTFSWIIQDSASPFPKWLRSDQNIFWISGKAGSGKSTLMKYISSHTFVRSLLGEWAGENRLVVLDSYLWNPGSKMQRTEQGLLQGILYQIFKSCDELIECATPERLSENELFHHNPRPWSLQELRKAFDNIFDQVTVAEDEQILTNETDTHDMNAEAALKQREKETHFCFFIDGLDEYQGEQWRLVDIVKSLAKSPRIKICVSSRPWNIFRNAFSHLPSQLQLEQLTQADITHYVQSELGQVVKRYGKEARTLVSSIVEKAEGVFFWVYLVVRSLREGFEEGDSIMIMHQRLNEFPADLGEYFEHMLSRVSKTYRSQTPQALKLATLTIGPEEPITFTIRRASYRFGC